MGWLRLVGSLKLQVSFAEYRLFHRALLQKRPIILRSLRVVATPYLESEGDRGVTQREKKIVKNVLMLGVRRMRARERERECV